MKWVKRIAAVVGALVVLAAVGAGSVYLWAKHRVNVVFAKDWETHVVDFPVPFPLTPAEIAELRGEQAPTALTNAVPDGSEPAPADVDALAGIDLDAIALERARARGKHYAEAIFVCVGCHGADLAGGTMMDVPIIGHVEGPDITRGGLTKDFTVADFDRAIRHGVLPGGHTSVMPVGDFAGMTDHELSDIIAYIDSVPQKAPTHERIREWGPMGTMLIASGKLVADVYKVPDHFAAHPVEPPPAGPTAEYGKHLAGVCVGCHRADYNGGPLPFGPPDWPPAANLTPTPDGVAGWTFDDFQKAFQRGVRPDGSTLRPPMSDMLAVSPLWTDEEVHALWAFLQTLPATPTGT